MAVAEAMMRKAFISLVEAVRVEAFMSLVEALRDRGFYVTSRGSAG